MTEWWSNGLLIAVAVGSGLIAGIFFAFSNFIMRALGRGDSNASITLMREINRTVLNPGFLTFFFGTAVIAVGIVVATIIGRFEGENIWIYLGCALYVIGTFGVTVVFNVPMNRRLESFESKSPEVAAYWSKYLQIWTRWNHVRTICSTLAMLSFMTALC